MVRKGALSVPELASLPVVATCQVLARATATNASKSKQTAGNAFILYFLRLAIFVNHGVLISRSREVMEVMVFISLWLHGWSVNLHENVYFARRGIAANFGAAN